MPVMILAAGRGDRMMPLTQDKPKPLLEVAGKSLIEHQLDRLMACGFSEFVINLGYRGKQIEQQLGNGHARGCSIVYSDEGENVLETGGGIQKALPLLGEDPFIVLNADVWCDFNFSSLPTEIEGEAHLVLVKNPLHNPAGDFALSGKRVANEGQPRFTFSGIGIYSKELFCDESAGRFPLAPVLRKAADNNAVTGELFPGRWFDIGTPERLLEIQQINTSKPD